MMKISLAEYIREVLDDTPGVCAQESSPTAQSSVCPGCLGHGRYVGFRRIEDPCQVCNGSGRVVGEGERAQK